MVDSSKKAKTISIAHWNYAKRSVIYHYTDEIRCCAIITDMDLTLPAPGKPIKAHIVFHNATLAYHGGGGSMNLCEEGKKRGMFEFIKGEEPAEIVEYREWLKEIDAEEKRQAVADLTKEVMDAARETKLSNSDATGSESGDRGGYAFDDPVPPEPARNSRASAVKDSRLRK